MRQVEFVRGTEQVQYVSGSIKRIREKCPTNGRPPIELSITVHDGQNTVSIKRECRQPAFGIKPGDMDDRRDVFWKLRDICNQMLDNIDDWERGKL